MADIKEAKQISEDLFNFTKRFVATIMDSDFMSDEPNNNSDFQEALSILTMSAIDLFIHIRDNTEANNPLVAGILTRSLIETTANINFLVANQTDKQLITDFLNTSQLVAKKLYDIKLNDISKGIKWTRVPITDRINLLENRTLNYLAAWHYFSSYSHGDAGYLGSHYHKQSQRIPSIALSLSCILFIEIGESLDSAGLLKEGFNKTFFDAAKSYPERNE